MSLLDFRLPGEFARWKPGDFEWYRQVTTLLLSHGYKITKEDVQATFENNTPLVAFHILQSADATIKNDPYFLFLASKLAKFPKLFALHHIISLADPPVLFRTKKHPNQALAIVVRDCDGGDCIHIVKLLIKNGIRLDGAACPALLEAVKKGRHDVMELLLEGGANPNGCSGRVVQTAYARNDKVALRLLERYGGVLNVIRGRGRRRQADGSRQEIEPEAEDDDVCGAWD
ncbi:hypothetical protein HDV00_005348 [Rhizophlyctis rosea]|nr:hypothetical protein HDV00_005348 [Rhizophlyctis rosea]